MYQQERLASNNPIEGYPRPFKDIHRRREKSIYLVKKPCTLVSILPQEEGFIVDFVVTTNLSQ